MVQIPKIEVGTSAVIQKKINEKDAALNYGSGQLENLLATPSLVALMIEAAVNAVDPLLPEGIITVGKMSQIVHENPTILGATVTLKVEVKDFDGTRLVFDMIAYDEFGTVGTGTHERIIVNKIALLEKAMDRAEKSTGIKY